MNQDLKWTVAAVAVVCLSAGAWVYFSRSKSKPAPEPPVEAAASPAGPEEPAIKHPLPIAPSDEAMPALDTSDSTLRGALESLTGKEFIERHVVTEQLIRHIVVTVDNLSADKLAERVRPLQAAPGRLAVRGSEGALELDPANYERYAPLIRTLGSMDAQQIASIYTRYYPLFQEAYVSLGHPPEYFNDRLIEVIDHLLATPEHLGVIALAQPNVQYEFADPKLEALSAGQKALIRVGDANAAIVKAKLRELRALLISH